MTIGSKAIISNERGTLLTNIKAEIGLIARPDNKLLEHDFKRIIISTDYGILNRAFWGKVDGRAVVVIYGRFDEVRSTAADINFEKTQAALNVLGVKTIIGTFVTGGIKKGHKIGTVSILDNLVGLGGYNCSLYKKIGFRDVDLFQPFCKEVRKALIKASCDCKFKVQNKGTYACFHGYPRIETSAELDFYAQMGWDIVGQTLDPEVTLARESRCCYAAVTVTIDSYEVRKRFLSGDVTARNLTRNAIPNGRAKTTELVFKAIKYLPRQREKKCKCSYDYHSEKNYFRHLPDFILNGKNK